MVNRPVIEDSLATQGPWLAGSGTQQKTGGGCQRMFSLTQQERFGGSARKGTN